MLEISSASLFLLQRFNIFWGDRCGMIYGLWKVIVLIK